MLQDESLIVIQIRKENSKSSISRHSSISLPLVCWSFRSFQQISSFLRRLPTCVDVHSWQLYSATPLGDKAFSTAI